MFRPVLRHRRLLVLMLLAPSLMGAKCAFKVVKSGGTGEGEGGASSTIVIAGKSSTSGGIVARPATEPEWPEGRVALLAPDLEAQVHGSLGPPRLAAPALPEPKSVLVFGSGAVIIAEALRRHRRSRTGCKRS